MTDEIMTLRTLLEKKLHQPDDRDAMSETPLEHAIGDGLSKRKLLT
jgi:hypothetical protein